MSRGSISTSDNDGFVQLFDKTNKQTKFKFGTYSAKYQFPNYRHLVLLCSAAFFAVTTGAERSVIPSILSFLFPSTLVFKGTSTKCIELVLPSRSLLGNSGSFLSPCGHRLPLPSTKAAEVSPLFGRNFGGASYHASAVGY